MLATATASNMTMQGLCGIKEGLHGDCIKDSEIDRCAPSEDNPPSMDK